MFCFLSAGSFLLPVERIRTCRMSIGRLGGPPVHQRGGSSYHHSCTCLLLSWWILHTLPYDQWFLFQLLLCLRPEGVLFSFHKFGMWTDFAVSLDMLVCWVLLNGASWLLGSFDPLSVKLILNRWKSPSLPWPAAGVSGRALPLLSSGKTLLLLGCTGYGI